jgi:hypothetical protein
MPAPVAFELAGENKVMDGELTPETTSESASMRYFSPAVLPSDPGAPLGQSGTVGWLALFGSKSPGGLPEVIQVTAAAPRPPPLLGGAAGVGWAKAADVTAAVKMTKQVLTDIFITLDS